MNCALKLANEISLYSNLVIIVLFIEGLDFAKFIFVYRQTDTYTVIYTYTLMYTHIH